MLDDLTSTALHVALTGLSDRQRVIAHNVANIQTPNFQAQQLQFEAALGSAVAAGNPAQATSLVTSSRAPARTDGNNVNLDEQTLSNVDTGLRFQLMLRAMDDKFSLLRDAIRGGA
ncbi:MAG: flagellar biosynthesis protein FlgB [Actinobacteria bacterium]|nr:flagellar biosynthesis protein FlgB [Actinomycetota bacterium]